MDWKVIPTGRAWVDPGSALGLIPRPLWIKYQTPDEHQRVPMDLNSLLIYSDGKIIIVDTGLGHKLSERGIRNWGLEWPEGTLEENLAKEGISPENVDIVIETHLHSDHSGGNTIYDGEKLIPAFPNAHYIVQRLEFADAYHPNSRTRATYLKENFITLWEREKLTLLHGDYQVTKDVRCVVTRGHTRGHQSVIISTEEQPVFFVSDLAGYSVQFARAGWVSGNDVEPLETISSKLIWQEWAVAKDALLVFQHDTTTRLGKLIKNDEGKFEIEVLERSID